MDGSWHELDRARHNKLTLDDYITASYIARVLNRGDYMPIFTMKKNGTSYKELCKTYGLNWGQVRRHKFPPRSMLVGSPARRVRDVTDEEIEQKLVQPIGRYIERAHEDKSEQEEK